MAQLTVHGVTSGAQEAMKRLQAAISALLEEQLAANRASVEGAQTAIIANTDLRASYDALIQTVRAQAVAQVTAQREKVEAIELEIKAVQSATATFAAGSAERQALIAREIELQGALAAAAGRSAAASLGAGGVGARVGPHGRFTGSAAAEEKGIGRGFLSRATGVGGWIAGPGFIAGAAAAIAAKQSSEALRRIQEEMSQLEGAVTNAKLSWGKYRKEIEETVKTEENLGVKESDTLRGLTALVRVTGSVEKARKQETLAINIARGAHVSYEAAVAAVVQADNGRFRGLQRLIGPIKNVTTNSDALKNAHIKVTDANRASVVSLQHRAVAMDKQLTMQKALATAEQKFAGEAARHMRTAEGATDRRRVSIEKLEVSIGKGLLPIEHKLEGAIAKLADRMRTSESLHENLRKAGKLIGLAWSGLTTILKGVSIALSNQYVRATVIAIAATKLLSKAILANPYTAMVLGLIVAIGLIKKHFTELQKWIGGAFLRIIQPFSTMPGKMGQWARDAKVRIQNNLDGIALDEAGAKAQQSFQKAWEKNMVAWKDPYAKLNRENPLTQGQANALGVGGIVGPKANAKSQATALKSPGTGLGTVAVSSTANKGGQTISGNVIIFVRRVASILGHSVTITTGTNHNEYVSGTNSQVVSDHYSGHAADIAARGQALVRIGQAALIAAGMNPAEAGKHDSYASTYNGVTIIFNIVLARGGDHTNHCHIGLKGSLPHGFNKEGTHGVQVSGDATASTTPTNLNADIASAAAAGTSTSGKGSTRPKGMPTPGAGGGSVDKLARKHGFRTMYGQTLVNYIATKAKQLGLDPAAVLAVASVEGGFQGKVGDHGTSFGPFQLHAGGKLPNNVWSQGVIYARAWANSAQGIDYALKSMAEAVGTGHTGSAAVSLIVRDFEAPSNIPAEISKATGRLGQTHFTTGRIQGAGSIPGVQEARSKLVEQAKSLRDLLTSAIKMPGTTVEDIFGNISGKLGSLSQLGVPVTAATQVLIDKLKKLRDRLDHLLKNGLVSKQAIAAIRAQMKELGRAISSNLSEQVIRAEHERSQLIDHVRQTVQRRQEAQLKDFDRATQAQISAMRSAFERQMREFDKVTQAGLQRFVVPQTGAESALKAFQDQRAAQQQAQLAQQLQGDLAKAVTGGDPQAIADAQKAIQNMQLDEQEHALEVAAQQSRTSQDILTQQQQDQYNEQRENLKQSLQAREDQLEQSYQDSRDIIRQGMEDANTAELDQLNLNLEIWNAWLNEKAQSVTDFYKWLQQYYGIGPGAIKWSGGGATSIHLSADEEKALRESFERGVGGAAVPFRTNRNAMAEGGTIRAPRFINRGDMIPAMLGHNETVISSDLTDALWAMVEGGGGSGVNVVVTGNTLLGRDRDVAREIATLTAPEIERIISYKPML